MAALIGLPLPAEFGGACANRRSADGGGWRVGAGSVVLTGGGWQARLASLMAALIGLPFPRNAVETLPLEYLDIPLGTPHT